MLELSDTSFLVLISITLVSSFLLLKFLQSNYSGKNLPHGSLGLPIIGESWSFFQAMRANRGPDWINERVAKHGPVFKTSLMGSPTVVVTGQAGNKFVFTTDESLLCAKQPVSLQKIIGKYNLFHLPRNRYKLVKAMMMRFLKLDGLQNRIGHIDDLVKTYLQTELHGKENIGAVLLMKKLSFHVSCTLLFGIHDQTTKEALLNDLTQAIKGVWSIPLNLPGTPFRRGVRARSEIIRRMLPIMRQRKEQILEGTVSPTNDIISCMLAPKDDNKEPITEEEIMDNSIALMIASHDTSASLLTSMIWKLGRDPNLYQKVVQEQMEILREIQSTQGKLSWSTIQKMRYTWSVAQELLRLIPPAFGGFRTALQDINFGGYDIPEGWQVFWVSSATHMNHDIFLDPSKFNPSRFENPSKPILSFSYIPFGAGQHTCIGNEFARVLTLIVIHHLVTNYEWSQVNPSELIAYKPVPFPSMGLPIKIKARNP